jgi:hypothetical protein
VTIRDSGPVVQDYRIERLLPSEAAIPFFELLNDRVYDR